MQIEMKGIDKAFGTNQVLKDAGFVLGDGEVHALMGENGAGKSTLMKILTGVYTKDKGTVLVNGTEVCYKNPQEAERAGIVFIHQELNVLFDLTVEENLFMGKEIKNKFGLCNQKAMRKKAAEALERLGVKIDPAEVMSNLSVGQQQMIEICKRLWLMPRLLLWMSRQRRLHRAKRMYCLRLLSHSVKQAYPLYIFLIEWKKSLNSVIASAFCGMVLMWEPEKLRKRI